MNGKCIEIGTIQAFLDGETAPELSLRISDHILECEACSAVLDKAEDDTSFVMATLDRELDSLVPTQRLWGRINDSIARESKPSVFTSLASQFRLLFVSRSVTGIAGVAMVALIFAGVWVVRQPQAPIIESARTTTHKVPDGDVVDVPPASSWEPKDTPTIGSKGTLQPSPKMTQVKASSLPPEKLRRLVTAANVSPRSSDVAPQYAFATAADSMSGEESYVRTIRDLKQDVDSKKDGVLNPSSRIAYERDMAVVDDAIKKMRVVVEKNPKNESARQVLYASYQNKIDLLNSVSERGELMARLR